MGDLVLNGEDVGEIAVVAVGPEVTAVFALDELRGDAHARAGLADAAFQDESDPEILAHPLHVHRPALVDKRRIARDDEQAGDLRQVGDDVLGDAIAEIILARGRRSYCRRVGPLSTASRSPNALVGGHQSRSS